MNRYILETKDLYFEYPDKTKALNGINIKFEKGKKIALLGANGAGKSTLFLHLNGILKPTKGKILYNGKKISYKHSFLHQLRKSVGIVFQDPETQLFSASVFQEVSFGAVNLKLPDEEVKARVLNAFEETGISYLQDKPTHALSYGQKKRVSIADILVMKPEVIIFDEPTAFLDPLHKEKMITLFDKINRAGTTIILSTHDVDMVYPWADMIYVMKDGKILRSGSSEEIFMNKNLLEQSDLAQPTILEIYAQLQSRGRLLDAPVPKNQEELVDLLAQ